MNRDELIEVECRHFECKYTPESVMTIVKQEDYEKNGGGKCPICNEEMFYKRQL